MAMATADVRADQIVIIAAQTPDDGDEPERFSEENEHDGYSTTTDDVTTDLAA